MPDPLALVATSLVGWIYAIVIHEIAVRGDGRSGRAAIGATPLWASGTGRLRDLEIERPPEFSRGPVTVVKVS